ncbi:hypothetical protein EZ449_21455 [Pedobacter frigidisoli]|uniref:Uncharacterized protein n=1 Tax=Pedobacter frigidisoli TaxID=2530455 RepID=A0A4V2MKP7_9SPHI|nr:hypothetical protein [Pedobacter frigidisoli]TCC99096.1 hypothetical protein EZ449_21455 [Pedobacter frigidisoli]
MENLNTTLVKTLFIISIIAVFASCKKEKTTEPEIFDPTRYYITGEYLNPGAKYPSTYVFTFLSNAKSQKTAIGGLILTQPSYTYTDGVFNITEVTFNVADGNVTSTNKPTTYRANHLQKIPDADAFAGKTFQGIVAVSGVDNGKICMIKFTTDKKFTVTVEGIAQVDVGADYTLLNNGVAIANTTGGTKQNLMSIAAGQLYYSHYNNNTGTHYYGILNQQ